MVSLINSKLLVPIRTRKNKGAKASAFFPATVDTQRFYELYQAHHRQIFNLCLRVTKNKDAAEDITVKVFVELYKGLKNSNAKIENSAYIRQLAVSNLLNYFHSSCKFDLQSNFK